MSDFDIWFTGLKQKIKESDVIVSVVPSSEYTVDCKFALELGLSIMADKPIIAIVRPGVRLPEKLCKCVDRFVEANSLKGNFESDLHHVVTEFLKEREISENGSH